MRLVWISLLVAVTGLALVACEEEGAVAMGKNGPPPPADAQYLDKDVTPEGLMLGAIRASKSPGALAQVVSEVKGLWVPEPGWFGTVEKVTDQQGGTTLGMKYYVAGIVGGEFWVLAIIPPGLQVKEGEQLAVQGKIRDIEIKMAVTPVYRIILEQCRILERPSNPMK